MEHTRSLIDGKGAGKVVLSQLVLLLPEVDGAKPVPKQGGREEGRKGGRTGGK